MMDLGQLEAERAGMIKRLAHHQERVKALQALVDKLSDQIVAFLNDQQRREEEQGLLSDVEPMPPVLEDVLDEDMDAPLPAQVAEPVAQLDSAW